MVVKSFYVYNVDKCLEHILTKKKTNWVLGPVSLFLWANFCKSSVERELYPFFIFMIWTTLDTFSVKISLMLYYNTDTEHIYDTQKYWNVSKKILDC